MASFMSLFRPSTRATAINQEALWMVKLESHDGEDKQWTCLNIKFKYS